MAAYHPRIHGPVASRSTSAAQAPRTFNWGLVFGMSVNLAVWGLVGLLVANLL